MDERDVTELGAQRPNDSLEESILQRSGTELGELVQEICSQNGKRKNDVAEAVYKIVQEGKGKLIDPSPPLTYVRYLFSHYSSWFWFIVGIIGALISSIFLLPSSYPFIYIRYVTGTVFIFFIPGYALVEAFFNKREIERHELIAISMGLSLSITPLLVLALNYTSVGLDLKNTLTILSAITVLISIFGVHRKFLRWMERNPPVENDEIVDKEQASL